MQRLVVKERYQNYQYDSWKLERVAMRRVFCVTVGYRGIYSVRTMV
jgi:hypothetical protein